MNSQQREQLKSLLELWIDDTLRINSYKEQKYWYPISMATYGLEEVIAAVDSLCSFLTTMWKKTADFENQFSGLIHSKESIMVNSGSSADLLIAFALVNPKAKLLARGDEILVPSVTWPTQVWSAMMAGLKVRLVDADPATLNVNLDDLSAKITPRTRALSLVHLMGNPCDMDTIFAICRKHNLLLIEDCCESLGARFAGKPVGSFGVASSFSFFFSHHITTMEGGMICCQDEVLSDLFRLLRAHGWARNLKYVNQEKRRGLDPRYLFLNWGFNVRPTELQAGFGLEQLKRTPGYLFHREKNASYFENYFRRHHSIMRMMQVHPKAECSWFALPIVLTAECPFTRDALVNYLEEQGVETRPIVAGNLARQPACDVFPEIQDGELPGADIIHDRGFYLGLHPLDESHQLDRLAEVFDRFVCNYA